MFTCLRTPFTQIRILSVQKEPTGNPRQPVDEIADRRAVTLRGLEAVLRSDVDDPRVVEVVAESVLDVAVGVEVLRYRSLEAAAHIEPRAVVVEGDIRTLGGYSLNQQQVILDPFSIVKQALDGQI